MVVSQGTLRFGVFGLKLALNPGVNFGPNRQKSGLFSMVRTHGFSLVLGANSNGPKRGFSGGLF